MATRTRRPGGPAQQSAFFLAGARPLWALAALLVACGDDGEGDAPGDGPVELSVFAGCEDEFHGSCDVLDAGCQERVFATARCLRRQPDAVLPMVRVISEDELVAELTSEAEALTEATGTDPVADAAADEATVRALELLGLAQPGELSEEGYVQVFVDTVPAFYTDDDDVITLVDGALGDDSLKTLTLLHELVHALQDQDLSLAALGTDEEMTFDQYLAALSIVEGEAAMLESFVEAAGWGFERDPDFRKSYTSWVAAAELQFAGQSPLLVSPRYFPYSYGARFVFDVFTSEGTAGVRARFDAPPASVLPMLLNESGPAAIEPDALLDVPEPVAPAGFVRLVPDSFGPWVLGKFVELSVPGVLASDLPSHWRGDRALAWSSDTDGVAAVWTIRFDSAEAANELYLPLRSLALMGLPSPNAFCVQSGRDVTLGVAETTSSRDLWADAVENTGADSSSAAAATPSELPATMPSSRAAGAPGLHPPSVSAAHPQLQRPSPWRGHLARLARRAR
jgi:hypothetical protein